MSTLAVRASRRHRVRRRAAMPLLGGVRPPLTVLLCLLLALSAATAVGLGRVGGGGVPQAVREDERSIAADAAEGLREAIDAQAVSLRQAAAGVVPGSPQGVLAAVLPVAGGGVRGAAVVDARTGAVLAARGGGVPPDTGVGAGDFAPRVVAGAVVYAARVGGNGVPGLQGGNSDQGVDSVPPWSVVVAQRPGAPAMHGAGRIGELLGAGGGRTGPLEAAAERAAAGSAPGDSGSLLGAAAGGRRIVAGWASVGMGLTVLSQRAVGEHGVASSAGRTEAALWTAGALAVLALGVWLLLWGLVLRPLLRLRNAAVWMVLAVYRGEPEALLRPVPVPRFGELRLIGWSLEALRRQLIGDSRGFDTVRPPRLGVRALVVCCAAVLTLWAVPLVAVVNQVDDASMVPPDVVAAQQARTAMAADRVAALVSEASGVLAAGAAELSTAPGGTGDVPLLRQLRREWRGFRSVYELDAVGRMGPRAGQEPLRALGRSVPSRPGPAVLNSRGAEPAIAVHAPLGRRGQGAVLVGEVEVQGLDAELGRSGLGAVYLVDGRLRVLASSTGFRAFEALPHAGLVRLAREGVARGSAVGGLIRDGVRRGWQSSDAVAAVAPVGAVPGWYAVSSEPTGALKLAPIQLRARTELAGLLGLTVVVGCLGWLLVVVVGPLRALAAAAVRLAEGDRRTVLYPVQQDEIGVLARSLELLRRVVQRQRW